MKTEMDFQVGYALKKNIANFIKKKLLNLKLNDSVIHKRKPEMLNRLKIC